MLTPRWCRSAGRLRATGLTLTQAGHAILFDFPWSPAKESQAIDRAQHLVRTRTVTVRQFASESVALRASCLPSFTRRTVAVARILGMPEDGATAYVRRLAADKRYVRDVY
ncbi:hypothetical protein [Streptomyces sp. NPDC059466]|uniref:hypothetical protein n=1 Tax=unclassified Streptomyces TaxID=2593676 RepID=UPI0036A752E2